MIDESTYTQADYDEIFSQNDLNQRNDRPRDKVILIASSSSGGRFRDFDFYGDHYDDDEDGDGVWRMLEVWKFVGGGRSVTSRRDKSDS